MSNLQCPVTVILSAPGDVPGLAEWLREERISTVWCESQAPALHAAKVIAAELGAPVRRVQAASVDALESLADEFRGETLLGIVSEPVFLELLEELFPSQQTSVSAPGESCRLSYDGGAWTISLLPITSKPRRQKP